jgi:hypothetical protein
VQTVHDSKAMLLLLPLPSEVHAVSSKLLKLQLTF